MLAQMLHLRDLCTGSHSKKHHNGTKQRLGHCHDCSTAFCPTLTLPRARDFVAPNLRNAEVEDLYK